ncbi:hypothetical protein [Roseomonas sp. BN140053]|uniref:hypothetical protein n=1 Tax=Roseomonas sp. BN140053 TaxID=3391898 RepID=UPI0039EB95CA
MSNFFRRTGLTQLTNAQRRVAVQAGAEYFRSLSRGVEPGQGTETSQRIARAELRELGIPDAEVQDFARWMLQAEALPDVGDLQQGQGKLFGVAIARFVDQVIQNPQKVDRPELASHPLGRLMFGLTAFKYAFWRNVVTRMVNATARDADVRKQAGEDNLRAWGKSAGGYAGQAAVFAGTMFLGQLLVTVAREAIFNGEKWDERDKAGELEGWLMSQAWGRMGVTGPFEPLVRVVQGLRYERDLSSLLAGAQASYFLDAAGAMLGAAVGRNSANTNTAERNAVQGAWRAFGVPAAALALTALPGGPLTGALAGATMQYATSPQMAGDVATALIGGKGEPSGDRVLVGQDLNYSAMYLFGVAVPVRSDSWPAPLPP